jgi:hypothetical protein
VVGYPTKAIISRSLMYPEDEHVAHPRLYGAPAYARPPQRIAPTALPLDPDDLPIAVEQTPEERAMAEELLSKPFGVAERPSVRIEPEPGPQPQLLSAIAGRFLRRAS